MDSRFRGNDRDRTKRIELRCPVDRNSIDSRFRGNDRKLGEIENEKPVNHIFRIVT